MPDIIPDWSWNLMCKCACKGLLVQAELVTEEDHADKLNCCLCLCSRIGCYVTVFQNVSNLRDVFYKEMSVVSDVIASLSFCGCEVSDICLASVLMLCFGFAAEPWALQCDEKTGDSTLRESFHHQGPEQVRNCVATVVSLSMVSVHNTKCLKQHTSWKQTDCPIIPQTCLSGECTSHEQLNLLTRHKYWLVYS